MSSNKKQVGGTHYQTGGLQHWDAVYLMFNGDYLLGNATKYLARLGKKGGPDKALEDINKAIHYLEKKREILQSELEKHKADVAERFAYSEKFHAGDFPHVGCVPPQPTNPVTLGDLIRKELRYEGLEDSGDAGCRYTKQD